MIVRIAQPMRVLVRRNILGAKKKQGELAPPTEQVMLPYWEQECKGILGANSVNLAREEGRDINMDEVDAMRNNPNFCFKFQKEDLLLP